MNSDLAEQLLEQLRTKPAASFEHVVVRLLVQKGYGGRSATRVRRSGGAVTVASRHHQG
jgi:restriction endonuclease Mrr